jgi:hypothetical protein
MGDIIILGISAAIISIIFGIFIWGFSVLKKKLKRKNIK